MMSFDWWKPASADGNETPYRVLPDDEAGVERGAVSAGAAGKRKGYTRLADSKDAAKNQHTKMHAVELTEFRALQAAVRLVNSEEAIAAQALQAEYVATAKARAEDKAASRKKGKGSHAAAGAGRRATSGAGGRVAAKTVAEPTPEEKKIMAEAAAKIASEDRVGLENRAILLATIAEIETHLREGAKHGGCISQVHFIVQDGKKRMIDLIEAKKAVVLKMMINPDDPYNLHQNLPSSIKRNAIVASIYVIWESKEAAKKSA